MYRTHTEDLKKNRHVNVCRNNKLRLVGKREKDGALQIILPINKKKKKKGGGGEIK